MTYHLVSTETHEVLNSMDCAAHLAARYVTAGTYLIESKLSLTQDTADMRVVGSFLEGSGPPTPINIVRT